MPPKTKVPKSVIKAYNAALYRVKVPDNVFVLQIKQRSVPLAALMKDLGVESAAFVTAYNPFSQKTKAPANTRAHQELRSGIEKLGVVFYEAAGEDPSGKWKAEPGYLVLGIPPETAKVLGKKHGQNAVVWADSDGIPKLVLLR